MDSGSAGTERNEVAGLIRQACRDTACRVRWFCQRFLYTHQRSRTASGFCVYCSTFPEERQMNALPKRKQRPSPKGQTLLELVPYLFMRRFSSMILSVTRKKSAGILSYGKVFLTLSPAKSAEKMCGKDAKQALKMINLPEFMRWLFSWSLPEQERRCHAFSATIPTGWGRSRWSCKYPLRCPPSWERRSSGWNPDP